MRSRSRDTIRARNDAILRESVPTRAVSSLGEHRVTIVVLKVIICGQCRLPFPLLLSPFLYAESI